LKACLQIALDNNFLHRLREWFQEDLSRVKVFLFSRRDSKQIPLAFTTAGNIFLSDDVACSGSASIPVLIHEFAHVVQKMRGRSGRRAGKRGCATAATLEHEADEAAAAFHAWRRCPDLSPDTSGTARAWGPAGHYYTVYWVSRMTGVEHAIAEQYAFAAQMPDQVDELDATAAGKAWAKSAFIPCWFGIRNRVLSNETTFDNLVYSIQAGIHCLNGRSARGESDRRAKILKNLPKDQYFNFSFGLGLHSLGDSFAHQNGAGVLFMAPVGHAGQGWGLDHPTEVGHEIDNVGLHSEIYCSYVAFMFTAIVDALKIDLPFPLPHYGPKLNEMASKVCASTLEGTQITTIMQFYPELARAYRPEDDTVDWAKFRLRHPLIAAPWMLDKATQLAADWTI
jgi:hypothetical protein